jgi:flagellar assembly protein FliH
MMNMSSSPQLFASQSLLASAFLYRDVAAVAVELLPEPIVEVEQILPVHTGPTPEQLAQRIAEARREAAAEMEARMKVEMERRLAEQAEKIEKALAAFAEERRSYFGRVESDVVHLALAIAGKILHREAQVDPQLIAALVGIAVNKLHDGSRVTVRVGAAEVQRWSGFFANPSNGCTVMVVEDTNLAAGDFILETDLGSANFGIEAQLKEVEQGFFDLLAQRPAVK